MSIEKIYGIIPPLVTPFRRDGSIDFEALKAEVRFMAGVGAHGVAVCGSTGEGHTLTTDETREITAAAVEATGGRIPVITGIITNSTQGAIERAKAVLDLGPLALQVTPPHYLFRPDDEALLKHFDEISAKSGLPVIIYNVVPWSYLSPGLLVRILRDVDGVIGVKQSASDMRTLAELLLGVEEAGIATRVRILSAVDALLYPSFALGAHGSVAAILTAVPEWCVALWNAVQRGDQVEALALHKKLLKVWGAIEAPNLPANVRTVMRERERDGGVPRAPMPESSAEQVVKVREALAHG